MRQVSDVPSNALLEWTAQFDCEAPPLNSLLDRPYSAIRPVQGGVTMRSSIQKGSAVILSVFVVVECSSLALAVEKPLSILLTNDDGYDAPGISAMWRSLVDAGYLVTIVAPASQQSGSSVRTTSGPITLEKSGERIWAVGGSPADAVLVGLEYLLRDEPPDLVVSGSNFGQNIGQSVNMSGTVGAAIKAMQRGFPPSPSRLVFDWKNGRTGVGVFRVHLLRSNPRLNSRRTSSANWCKLDERGQLYFRLILF